MDTDQRSANELTSAARRVISGVPARTHLACLLPDTETELRRRGLITSAPAREQADYPGVRLVQLTELGERVGRAVLNQDVAEATHIATD